MRIVGHEISALAWMYHTLHFMAKQQLLPSFDAIAKKLHILVVTLVVVVVVVVVRVFV